MTVGADRPVYSSIFDSFNATSTYHIIPKKKTENILKCRDELENRLTQKNWLITLCHNQIAFRKAIITKYEEEGTLTIEWYQNKMWTVRLSKTWT